jgi:hypothetical protein
MMRRLILSLGLLVLLFPIPVHAGSPGPWIEIAGGFGTYTMGDVTDDIDAMNVEIAPLSMDHIKSGFSGGLEAGFTGPSHVGGSVGYERLFASSDVGDASGRLEYNFHANAFIGKVYWMAPRSERFYFGVAGSAGLVSAAGDVRLSISQVGSLSGDVSGSGPLFGGALVGELWSRSGRAALTFSAGYRYAKIGTVKVADIKILNEDGSDYALDYSGITLRVGARLALGGVTSE